MTDIFETTKTALDTLSIPFGMGLYLCDGELPDQYMVFTLIDGVPTQHADDNETERTYRVQVSIFDRNGLADLPDVDVVMLAAGFKKGPERQLPRDPESGHYCLAKDYFKI
jgi:hypothetical protein